MMMEVEKDFVEEIWRNLKEIKLVLFKLFGSIYWNVFLIKEELKKLLKCSDIKSFCLYFVVVDILFECGFGIVYLR